MDDKIKMLNQLTICSVSFKSAELLKLNLELTLQLNKVNDISWLVIDNNGDFIDNKEAAVRNFQIIEGDQPINSGRLKASYHHAQALNKALKYISTRYLLVLDPDFFIIRRNWIVEVLQHASKQGLSFWGAPYYPDLTWKRRYFPNGTCMLIDLDRVSKDMLDFTPELDEYHTLFGCSTLTLLGILAGRIPGEIDNKERSILAEIAKGILRNRWLARPLSIFSSNRIRTITNISHDTGFKIQNAFGDNRDYIYEMLEPSFENPLYTRKGTLQINLFAKLYLRLIPEVLSIYPKRREYTTNTKFKNFGLVDVRGQFGWEEYFWKEKPFAIHIKGGTSKFKDIGYEKLNELLFQLVGNPA